MAKVEPVSNDSGITATITFAYVVTDTSTNKLAIYAYPVSAAAATAWEGGAAIEITKIA